MTQKPLLLYIAGPYRGDVDANIARARSVAIGVWRMGHVALCPHQNSAGMDGIVPDEQFLEGGLLMLARCDGMVLVPGWERSEGTLAEVAAAKEWGIPVYEWPDLPEDGE